MLPHEVFTDDQRPKGTWWCRDLAGSANHMFRVRTTSNRIPGGCEQLHRCTQGHFCPQKSKDKETSTCNLLNSQGLERQRKTEEYSRLKGTETKKTWQPDQCQLLNWVLCTSSTVAPQAELDRVAVGALGEFLLLVGVRECPGLPLTHAH